MSCDWEGDKKCFEGEGLVVRPREKEVCFRGWDRAGYEWYYGGVGDVESGIDSEDVGGVALEACNWGLVSWDMEIGEGAYGTRRNYVHFR